MGDVVDLQNPERPVLPPGEPDPNVVERLEELLEMALSGEIVGIAGTFSYRDKASGLFMRGNVSYSMVGRMEEVKLALLDALR